MDEKPQALATEQISAVQGGALAHSPLTPGLLTGRKNGFTRVTKLEQKCSKCHICTNLLKSAQEQRLILH